MRGLQIEPELRGRAEMLRQAQRRICRHCPLLARKIGNAIVGNPENLRELACTHPERHEAFFAQDFAWVGPEALFLLSDSPRSRHLHSTAGLWQELDWISQFEAVDLGTAGFPSGNISSILLFSVAMHLEILSSAGLPLWQRSQSMPLTAFTAISALEAR